MWKIFFITFGLLTLIEGVYLLINWKKIKILIGTMKVVNGMMDTFKNMGFDTPTNTKSFKMRVAIFIGNHIGDPWVLVLIILIMNLLFSLVFSAILSLLILIVN